MTAGRFAGDWIVHRLGGTAVMVLGGGLAAAGFALAVFAPSEPLALAGFLLVGLGASNIVPVLFTAVGRQTAMPASLAVAAMTTVGYAGVLAGPALVGFVAQVSSLEIGFLLIALGLVFVAATGPLVRPR